MIKAVIFDIGGVTIKDPMAYIYRAVEREFKVSSAKVVKFYDNELGSLVSTNKISTKEFWTRLAKELNIVDATALENVWMDTLKKYGVLDQGVIKLIKSLKQKGYKVSTISNTFKPPEKFHIKFGHYKFFDHVFLSNRLKMRKPEAMIYRYAIKKLNVKPSECVFIDDRLENVQGARRVGMKAILFKDAVRLERDLKRYL